jgi:hypothetical protein
MKKIIYIIMISLVTCSSSMRKTPREQPQTIKPIYANPHYERRLRYAESRMKWWAKGRHRKNGPIIALGEFQITRPWLREYNKRNKRKFDFWEMTNTKKARIVYTYGMRRNYNYLSKMIPDRIDLIVCLTNAYTMGVHNTINNGRFHDRYLREIVPSSWARFKERHKMRRILTKKGYIYIL